MESLKYNHQIWLEQNTYRHHHHMFPGSFTERSNLTTDLSTPLSHWVRTINTDHGWGQCSPNMMMPTTRGRRLDQCDHLWRLGGSRLHPHEDLSHFKSPAGLGVSSSPSRSWSSWSQQCMVIVSVIILIAARYECLVQARNRFGWSDASRLFTFYTSTNSESIGM